MGDPRCNKQVHGQSQEDVGSCPLEEPMVVPRGHGVAARRLQAVLAKQQQSGCRATGALTRARAHSLPAYHLCKLWFRMVVPLVDDLPEEGY